MVDWRIIVQATFTWMQYAFFSLFQSSTVAFITANLCYHCCDEWCVYVRLTLRQILTVLKFSFSLCLNLYITQILTATMSAKKSKSIRFIFWFVNCFLPRGNRFHMVTNNPVSYELSSMSRYTVFIRTRHSKIQGRVIDISEVIARHQHKCWWDRKKILSVVIRQISICKTKMESHN